MKDNSLDNEYRAILGLSPITKIEKVKTKNIPIKYCIIFFGKYRGKLYVELPESYLEWLIKSNLDKKVKHNASRALASIRAKKKNRKAGSS